MNTLKVSEISPKAPLFSVIVPCYNYALLLDRAVSSVLKQTESDWELLLIDDGSTDDTATVLLQYQKQYPGRVSFYSQENQGPAAARNLGVRSASGLFMVFLDADDELLPNALSVFRQGIEQNTNGWVFIAGHNAVSGEGKVKYHPPGKKCTDSVACVKSYLLEKSLTMSHGSFAVRRSVFHGYQYPEQLRSSEDVSVFVYWLANFSVVLLDRPVSLVHKHSDSLRHDIQLTKDIGLAIVDEVFDASRLPADVMMLRNPYWVQRLLSMSRTAYSAKEYELCRRYYLQAFSVDWKVILKSSYLSKFLRACVKA